jgi:hypothetical protein
VGLYIPKLCLLLIDLVLPFLFLFECKLIQVVLSGLFSGLQLFIEKVLFTGVYFLFNLLKMFDLPSVVSLSVILKSLEGRKLKIKTQHVLVIWKV